MSDIQDEIREVLSHPENVQFEELEGEESSPLNEPVANSGDDDIQSEPAQEQPASSGKQVSQEPKQQDPQPEEEADEPLDAGEQEIDDNYDEATIMDDGEEFELPTGHAKQAADTILGMTDNVLAVGGGYFVKIRKHKEFYEFEEIIQVVDNQNEKNIRRMKLDEEDKILLRPLLISILKKKAKKLTPEQQLMGAIISIMMKKAQVVMEIKAENDILTERILDIIREEKGYSEQDEDYQGQADENEDESASLRSDKTGNEPEEEYQYEESASASLRSDKPGEETVEEVEEQVVVKQPSSQTITPAQVMEVAEDDPEEKPAAEKQESGNGTKSDKK